MKTKTLLAVGLILFSFNGLAEESQPDAALALTAQQFLAGTSDAFEGALNMSVLVDSQGHAQDIQTSGAQGSTDFPLSQLPNGIVIYSSQGRTIVTVTSSDFNDATGGTVQLNYLNNGIVGDYESVTLEVQYSAKKWEALADNGNGYQPVTQAYFQSNKFLGETVGISSITFQ